MLSSQEPKYRTDDNGRIVNRKSGEIIPDSEPIMIFRARDQNAVKAIEYYKTLCMNREHKRVVDSRIDDFNKFAKDNMERMHEADS